ncbi:MAG: hypothetical protein HQL66_09100, partial [Magnetococcales bacterium]|nr:hypothetical protein [Magnetococcales bacterium]
NVLIDNGSGRFIAGDGSGGGGGAGNQNYTSASPGGAGGGSNSTLYGTNLNDVIFGDGSGGGGGDYFYGTTANGGAGGGGSDTIRGGGGNDIIFGDGFTGGRGYHDNTAAGTGGAGGFGGGGGGGGSGGVNGAAVAQPGMNGGAGGIGAGGGGGGAPLIYTLTAGSGGTGGIGGGITGNNGAVGNNTQAGAGGSGGNSVLGTAGGAGALGGDSNAAYPYYSGGGAGGGGGLNASSGGVGGKGGSFNSGGYSTGGAAGDTSVVMLTDTGATIYNYVSGQLANIFTSTPGTTSGYGAGSDTIDGGPGSDNLFGLGGNDVFVFELNDAGAADVDTVWDFDRNGEADKLKLTQGGSVIGTATLNAIIAAQTASGNDRSIVFTDNAGKQDTIVIKNIGRNLVASDFCSAGAADPLVLDLSGRGVQLTSMEQGVHFDVSGTGMPVQTAWMGAGNGLLVIPDSHGKISSMQNVVSGVMVPGARSSIEALATFDANHDGRIDAQDPAFAHLQVWTDRNHDGLSTPDELLSLPQLGIKSLGLTLHAPAATLVQGNQVTGNAEVVFADGHVGTMAEVNFTHALPSSTSSDLPAGSHTGVPTTTATDGPPLPLAGGNLGAGTITAGSVAGKGSPQPASTIQESHSTSPGATEHRVSDPSAPDSNNGRHPTTADPTGHGMPGDADTGTEPRPTTTSATAIPGHPETTGSPEPHPVGAISPLAAGDQWGKAGLPTSEGHVATLPTGMGNTHDPAAALFGEVTAATPPGGTPDPMLAAQAVAAAIALPEFTEQSAAGLVGRSPLSPNGQVGGDPGIAASAIGTEKALGFLANADVSFGSMPTIATPPDFSSRAAGVFSPALGSDLPVLPGRMGDTAPLPFAGSAFRAMILDDHPVAQPDHFSFHAIVQDHFTSIPSLIEHPLPTHDHHLAPV